MMEPVLDVLLSGFVANEEKSQWDPVQSGELLGFIMGFRQGGLIL